jgi:hypothetical protein
MPPNHLLEPWTPAPHRRCGENTRIPVRSSGTNGLRRLPASSAISDEGVSAGPLPTPLRSGVLREARGR